MFISISYVCVFVQYHQMAIPAFRSMALVKPAVTLHLHDVHAISFWLFFNYFCHHIQPTPKVPKNYLVQLE